MKKKSTPKHDVEQPAEEQPTRRSPAAETDLAKEFPTAHEELNRASVHLADRVRNALDRSKKLGANAADVSRISAVVKTIQSAFEDIDEIGK